MIFIWGTSAMQTASKTATCWLPPASTVRPGTTSHVFEVAKDDGEVVWDFTLPEDHSMYRAERITPPLVQLID